MSPGHSRSSLSSGSNRVCSPSPSSVREISRRMKLSTVAAIPLFQTVTAQGVVSGHLSSPSLSAEHSVEVWVGSVCHTLQQM